MKQIKTLTNSILLQELDLNGNVVSELGFKKGGCSYLIKNNNIKFYLTEDYLYKNVIWSADIPLLVNGVLYSIDTLPIALKNIFDVEAEAVIVDQELDSGSTNAIANHAVTVAIDERPTTDEVNSAITYATTPIAEDLASHTANTDVHLTIDDKETWNAKLDASDIVNLFGAV